MAIFQTIPIKEAQRLPAANVDWSPYEGYVAQLLQTPDHVGVLDLAREAEHLTRRDFHRLRRRERVRLQYVARRLAGVRLTCRYQHDQILFCPADRVN